MRVLWLLGADASAKRELEKHLDVLRVGVPYRVRMASALTDVPEEDLNRTSTVFLVDAFHPMYAGFNGVKALRKRGFKGAVFLFGEPAPANAITTFQQDALTGYFPSFEIADMALVAGVIHYQIHFDGLLDMKLFLKDSGRASAEQIRTFKDYNAFGAKLATFVGRFGVDIAQLKKVLMGLSLGHIKTTGAGPIVEQPFPIFYGMDPQKLVIAAPTYSRGVSRDTFMSHFCDVLAGLRDNKSVPGTIFPELFHVGRAADNLMVFSGNYVASGDTMDPVVLMATLPFPKVKEKPQAPYAVFAFCHSQPLLDEEMMPSGNVVPMDKDLLESGKAYDAVAPVAERREESPIEASPRPVPEQAPMGTINDVDLNSILNEPSLIGDAPVVADPNRVEVRNPLTSTSKAQRTELAPPKLGGSDYGASNEVAAPAAIGVGLGPVDPSELERLRGLNQALAADVKRLMKERRQPTTDRELRDAVDQLQDKLKRAHLQAGELERSLADKELEITTLKAQMESLKKSVGSGGKAAA